MFWERSAATGKTRVIAGTPGFRGGMASGAQAGVPDAKPEARMQLVTAAYEHPWAIRFTHWLNAVAVAVLAASGLRIFRAFPSFGTKIPEHDLVNIPPSLTLGGWLGGALQWHMTFAWIYVATGIFYCGYQIQSGNYRQFLFLPRDLPAVWPMVLHYSFFGLKQAKTEVTTPLKKMPTTSAILSGL